MLQSERWGWMEQERGTMVAQRPTLFSSSLVLQLHGLVQQAPSLMSQRDPLSLPAQGRNALCWGGTVASCPDPLQALWVSQ